MSDTEDISDVEREESPAPEPEPEPEPEPVETHAPPPPPAETGGKTEAELMMEEKKKRDKERMEAEIQEYKEQREEEIVKMNAEIADLTEKIARRKVEREEEERRLAEAAIVEQQRRKAEEDERQRKKKEAEEAKREEREKKRLEAENRASQMGKRSFVITKKSKSGEDVEEEDRKEEKGKSKEQLEAEKKAILEQRIIPLGDIDGLDENGLREKAKELHGVLFRLESDKYDLEQHFKQRQYEMMELADRARQMNKGKKKFAVTQDASGQEKVDPMAEKYSGIPPKIQLCSKYERHKDRRTYVERKDVFGGPIYAEEPERIKPSWEREEGDEAPAKPAGGDEEEED